MNSFLEKNIRIEKIGILLFFVLFFSIIPVFFDLKDGGLEKTMVFARGISDNVFYGNSDPNDNNYRPVLYYNSGAPDEPIGTYTNPVGNQVFPTGRDILREMNNNHEGDANAYVYWGTYDEKTNKRPIKLFLTGKTNPDNGDPLLLNRDNGKTTGFYLATNNRQYNGDPVKKGDLYGGEKVGGTGDKYTGVDVNNQGGEGQYLSTQIDATESSEEKAAMERLKARKENKCIYGENVIGFGINIEWCLAEISLNGILKPASSLYSLSGRFFDKVIEETVLNMSKYVGTKAKSETLNETINTIWKFFRDLGHIILVFSLLYIAIMIIIGNGKGDNNKMLVTVIMVAILINFSMMFTKLAIDASNLLTFQVHEKIKIVSTSEDSGKNERLSESAGYLGSQFKFQTIASTPYSFFERSGINTAFQITMISLGVSIFMFLSIIVFVSISILLISRFVVLIILMMTSSIYFASMVLPQLKQMIGEKWINTLTSLCVFAPVFMILYWASLLSIQGLMNGVFKDNVGGDGSTWTGLVSRDSDQLEKTITMILSFLISIGLLMASLLISKQVADKAGDGFKKISSFVGKKVGGAVFGTSGLALRASLGGAGNILGKIKGTGGVAVGIKKFGNLLAKQSFDLRHNKRFAGLNQAMGGTEFGEGKGAGGIKAFVDRRNKRLMENAENFEDLSEEQKERLEGRLETNDEYKDIINKEMDEENKIQISQNELNELRKKHNQTTDAAEKNNLEQKMKAELAKIELAKRDKEKIGKRRQQMYFDNVTAQSARGKYARSISGPWGSGKVSDSLLRDMRRNQNQDERRHSDLLRALRQQNNP